MGSRAQLFQRAPQAVDVTTPSVHNPVDGEDVEEFTLKMVASDSAAGNPSIEITAGNLNNVRMGSRSAFQAM